MAWNKELIAEGVLAPDLNDEIRSNWEAKESDDNREHIFSTGGTPADQMIHRQGSARCYYQATAPATRISGDAFTSNDNGSLWVDSDNKKPYILTDYTDPTEGNGWILFESLTIATLLAAVRTFAEIITFSKSPVFPLGIVGNDSYLTGRNLAGTANMSLIKVGTNNLATIPMNAEMSSSVAPTQPEGIANKKYVDDQDAFGSWSTKSINTEYTATTDGFVVAYLKTTSDKYLQIETPTGTVRNRDYGTDDNKASVTSPVRKGDTWKLVVEAGGSASVFWLPIGT